MNANSMIIGSTVTIGLAFLTIGMVIRVHATRYQDRKRKYYTVIFPRHMEMKAAVGFTVATSGVQPAMHRYLPTTAPPSFVLEAIGQDGLMTWRIGIPPEDADYIVGQLRLTGARVKPDLTLGDDSWDEAIELSLTSQSAQLDISADGGVRELIVSRILASFFPLREGERSMVQIICSPAMREMPSKEDKEHAEKHKLPTFDCVVRIAASAPDRKTARHLIDRLYKALTSMSTYGTKFKVNSFTPAGMVGRRVHYRTSAVLGPDTINAAELAILWAMPAGSPNVPGLPSGASRQLPADPSIPEGPFRLGHSNFPGQERIVGIDIHDRTRHMIITGPNGSGKTNLIRNLFGQEVALGYSVILIDPHGDLASQVADLIPRSRVDNGDVIYFNPTDETRPIGINVFSGEDIYLTADRIMNAFASLPDFKLDHMYRTSALLRAGVITLAAKGLTIIDLPALYHPGEKGLDFRAKVCRGLDHQVMSTWHDFNTIGQAQRAERAAPITHRLDPILIRPSLRAALGQANPTLDIARVLAERKILILDLAQGRIGEDTANLFAALILTQIWQATQSRIDIPEGERTATFLHMDEFQLFAGQKSLAPMLREARKYGLCLNFGTQSINNRDITPQVREAILTNTRSKIVFRTGAEEASTFARELQAHTTPADFQNLENYEAIVSLAGAPPATVAIDGPMPALGSAGLVKRLSRELYGVPIAQVEKEIAERQQAFREPRIDPSIGLEP